MVISLGSREKIVAVEAQFTVKCNSNYFDAIWIGATGYDYTCNGPAIGFSQA